MARFQDLPKPALRLIKAPPQIAYALGLGPVLGRVVLLLTTRGRKTGKPRVTPLQYEEADEAFWLGSERGLRADWVRNILADPNVEVRVKARRFRGMAEVITAPEQIADFLELRLKNHPRMVGAMLKGEGMAVPPARDLLEAYARNIALVRVTPQSEPTS